MSSKFFTWTKGDKSAHEAMRSRGVVPIPIECISFKGLDYERSKKDSSRSHRRPPPLRLDSSPDIVQHGARRDNSIALHDAAVQSATALIDVVNDMLRSPQVSNRLHQRAQSLQPMYGRPRSRTAPPTPMAEAPLPEPAELPGSMPNEKYPKHGLSHLTNAVIGRSIERPHTSPQESTHPAYSTPRSSVDAPRQPIGSPFAPMSARPLVATFSKHARSHASAMPLSREQDSRQQDSRVRRATTSTLKRPSLSVLQPWPDQVLQASDAHSETHDETSLVAPAATSSRQWSDTMQQSRTASNPEAILLYQMANMRESHVAHLTSLKQAHAHEIASHQSYIAFLESRKLGIRLGGLNTTQVDMKQRLTLDTAQVTNRLAEPLTSDASATTRKSFELTLEHEKRASQEAIAEAELLKRKLSLCRKSHTDPGELRRERDQFRDAVDGSERRITQLKDIIRKAKENERSLRNAVEDLQHRLTAANHERLDVQEGFHEACRQVSQLTQREDSLVKELDSVRSHQFYGNTSLASLVSTHSDQTHDRRTHVRTKSEVGLQVWSNDPLLLQVQRLQHDLRDRDTRIQHLEEQVKQQTASYVQEQERRAHLQSLVNATQQERDSIREDCDKYNSLLHNELRRQSRSAVERVHTSNPQIDAEAAALVASRLSSTDSNAPYGPYTIAPSVEQELEHCVREIIMYKLDVRGYKKDLKKAHAEIEELRRARVELPPTPDRQSFGSQSSSDLSAKRIPSATSSSGLGISLAQQTPKTPTRSVASVTQQALLSMSPPIPQVEYTTSPPPRSKTPLGAHKKLPKPPMSRSPSPMPASRTPGRVRQMERTPRSVSESIIASYAERRTPEVDAQGPF
ncbi:hypothetical protein B0A48_12666 [Cryoendolithus antarcticus]|uniref:Uncharacterized protein n=1 Tax=Cryoendolithus antarcticus TaxID=1507870 RepID=A0A1V8SRC7_9PEZI|nr:hypothetical protein B0A48_12666 [Cryoendolithus antarcticus]